MPPTFIPPPNFPQQSFIPPPNFPQQSSSQMPTYGNPYASSTWNNVPEQNSAPQRPLFQAYAHEMQTIRPDKVRC